MIHGKLNGVGRKKYMLGWIKENVNCCKSILELGAKFGDRLRILDKGVIKMGIEIYEPYFSKKCGVPILLGDMLNYRELVDLEIFNDCVMLIDTLEHIEQEHANKLLNDLKEDFKKILIITPEGEHIQKNVHEVGFSINKNQDHISYWYGEELEKMGFHTTIISDFHPVTEINPRGCIFAIWEKKDA